MPDSPPPTPMPRPDPAQAVQVLGAVQGGVVTLTFGGPMGNRLNADLIAALDAELARTLADPATRAVVLAARGADFCAGPSLDLAPPSPDDPGAPASVAALSALCARLDTAPRPVVAALHGRVIGGGLALALACHARVADARAQVQFPELALARLPAGNATVRLGWQVGAQAAWALLNARAPLPARQAQDMGLIDTCVSQGVVTAAIALADRLGTAMGPPVRTQPGLAAGPANLGAIRAARDGLPRPLPAHRAVQAQALDVLEAALMLPPEQALGFDEIRAQEAATLPPARAHAHVLRALHRVPETPETRSDPAALQLPPGPIVLMLDPPALRLWVPALTAAGLQVVVAADDAPRLQARLEAAQDALQDAIARGQRSAEQADVLRARIKGVPVASLTEGALGLCELHEAATLAQALAQAEILVWAAQGPALAEIAAAWGGRLVGVMPPPMLPDPPALPRLIEIVVPAGTRPQTRSRAHALCLRLRSTPLRSGGIALLPRMIQAGRFAARRLGELGVSQDALALASPLPRPLILPTPPTQTVLPAQALPLAPERLLHLALINEGARLLQEGRALRPSDIDLAMILGAGFPRWLGGPMAVADGLGVLVLRHELNRAARLDPAIWSPVPLLDEMIREGLRFGDLNTAE